ncbi:MAG: hypothetical protein K2I49_02990, partial [Ureaplasma sp.]|nr:hypothetical protein [Ureaplasma sp.]
TQLESFDNQIIHNAIDYAIKNYYYSKNLWLMQQARFDVDLSLAETGFNNSNPTFYGKERDWKEENNFIFQDLWVSSHNLNGLNVSIVNNGNTIKFKGLNFEQLLCFNMFLNHYEFERNSQSYSNRYNGWLWVNAENAYVNLFHSVKNSPWVDFYIKYNGYSAGDQGNGRDNKILEHGTNKNYPDRNFVSFKVDILKAYDISEKDKNQVYNNKEINVSLDRDFSLNDNINKNQNLVFVDYLNKNKYYSVDTENDNDVQEYLENNILKYNTLSDTSKTVFNEIANQVSKNIFDFEQQVSFNRNYVNIPSYWWNGKDNDPWEAKKDDIKKLYNDKTPYNLNNITNKDLLIQKYNNSFNLDKKIIYLDENNSNGFNIKYNSQILKFNNETTIEKLGVFKNAEIAPVIEYNGVPLFKINLSDKQMTKLQNINANNVIR